MKFSDVKNRTCLYLLGGIAGMEGPLLNIIQTRNGKLFFEFYNRERLRGEELMKTKTKDGFPIETKLPICIWQETTMEKLEKLLSKESLEQNEYEGPFLNEFMQLEGNPIYLEKRLMKNILKQIGAMNIFNHEWKIGSILGTNLLYLTVLIGIMTMYQIAKQS